MPPKCKFTREEIIQVSLELVREYGIQAVTARALGTKLGTSTKPIFSVFKNMEELEQETLQAARNTYNTYVNEGLSQPLPFKGVGIQYMRFARNEPKLFQLLFMTEQSEQTDALGVLPIIDDNYESILASVRDNYEVSEEEAKALYRHLWIYTHGIASLLATKVCAFQDEELDNRITIIFKSLLIECKKGNAI